RQQLQAGLFFGGASSEALTISSNIFLNSSKPGAGMMIVSRRPLTSSVMRRKRPRTFSLSAKTKVLRSIWILSVLRVSSLTGGLGPVPPGYPYDDERSFEIISLVSQSMPRRPSCYYHIYKFDNPGVLSTSEFARRRETGAVARISHAPKI